MAGRQALYENLALISDPIHRYIPFTVPYKKEETVTEKTLIDSAWVQRLRYINQLQSARWVFPSAEHSRFVHSLGVMHVAGRFAKQIYPSLKEQNSDCPSFCFIESLLRVTGLVHDIGHGPFCHFFDDHFLNGYDLTHEKLGQWIVKEELAPILKEIKRSPSGEYASGEELCPNQIAFLIGKELEKTNKTEKMPRWLVMLKPLFSGVFTVDNLDYVLRDAYMCGVAERQIDLDRLIYYTFFTKEGLTLHKAGLPALRMFLNARSFLYSNVYFHRTTRALDMHLQDIFPETMKLLFPYNPLQNREQYLALTDWSLLIAVSSWKGAKSAIKRSLFFEWQKIFLRDIKWKMSYDMTFSSIGGDNILVKASDLENGIRARLPKTLKRVAFRVDMAIQDPRPMNPLMMGDRQLYVYNPSNQSVSKEALIELMDALPATLTQCRIFTHNHDHDLFFSRVAEEEMRSLLKGAVHAV
ncbi:MAG: HD domain-containing protein [Nitrospirota bacterium]